MNKSWGGARLTGINVVAPPTGPPSVSNYPSPPPTLQQVVAQGETSSSLHLLPPLGAGNIVAIHIKKNLPFSQVTHWLHIGRKAKVQLHFNCILWNSPIGTCG